MHLSNLQGSQIPAFWQDEQYPDEFNQQPLPHRHFNHALTHAMKALGRLASYSDALDHMQMGKTGGRDPEAEALHDQRAKWLADLVICAARMSQQIGVDLDAATTERLITLGQRWGMEMPSTKPTIAELEAILNEPDRKVSILPNGEVVVA